MVRAKDLARILPVGRCGGVPCVLALIVIVAAFTRFAWLTSVPQGFEVDEVYNGYDAYCLTHLARDHEGRFLPWFFKGYDDCIPGVYRYSMLPFVLLLGPTVFAARICAALYGFLTIPVVYGATKRLWGTRVALISAASLAVSTWHISIGRRAHRPDLLPFYLSLFVLCLLLSRKERIRDFIFTGFVLAMATYSYASGYVFVPLLITAMALVYWRVIWTHVRQTATLALVTAILLLPMGVLLLVNPSWLAVRYLQSGVHLDPDPALQMLARVISNWLKYYSPTALFTLSEFDIYVPFSLKYGKGFGFLLLAEAPFLILGLLRVIKRRSRPDLVLLLWFLLFPAPGAITRVCTTWRGIGAFPAVQVLVGIGAAWALDLCVKRVKIVPLRTVFVVGVLCLWSANAVYCIQGYFRSISRPQNYFSVGDKVICPAQATYGSGFDVFLQPGELLFISDTFLPYEEVCYAWDTRVSPSDFLERPDTVLPIRRISGNFTRFLYGPGPPGLYAVQSGLADINDLIAVQNGGGMQLAWLVRKTASAGLRGLPETELRRLDRAYAARYAEMAYADFCMGRKHRADQLAEKALALDPGDPQARFVRSSLSTR